MDFEDVFGCHGGYPELNPTFVNPIDPEIPLLPPHVPMIETEVHTSPLANKKTCGFSMTEKNDVAASSTTSQSAGDAPEIVLRNENGWPLPIKEYKKGYSHCQETGLYHHESGIIYIKPIGNRVIWPGKGHLGFVYYEDDGMTVARIYDVKKNYISNKYFQWGRKDGAGKPSKDDIQKVLFEGSVWREDKINEIREGRRPFRLTLRHLILPKEDFEKAYTPNEYKNTYTRTEDKALKSLSSLLIQSDGAEAASNTPAAAFNSAYKEVKRRRQEYAKTDSAVFPCVEVYAFWHNLDVDAGLIVNHYDSMEPALYMMNDFGSAEAMKDCAF